MIAHGSSTDRDYMSVIFCPTIQATGTIFLINFFEAVTGQKMEGLPQAFNEKFKHEVNLVHIHVEWDGGYFSEINETCSFAHVVIPMRDPLASMVRGSTRVLDQGVSHAKSFLNLMEIGETHDAIYLPVDLLAAQSFGKRFKALNSILPDMYKGKKKYLCNEWAYKWPIYNAREYDLKPLYQNKDVKEMSKLPGWDILIENRSILQPWLETIGYQNLLWWK